MRDLPEEVTDRGDIDPGAEYVFVTNDFVSISGGSARAFGI